MSKLSPPHTRSNVVNFVALSVNKLGTALPTLVYDTLYPLIASLGFSRRSQSSLILGPLKASGGMIVALTFNLKETAETKAADKRKENMS